MIGRYAAQRFRAIIFYVSLKPNILCMGRRERRDDTPLLCNHSAPIRVRHVPWFFAFLSHVIPYVLKETREDGQKRAERSSARLFARARRLEFDRITGRHRDETLCHGAFLDHSYLLGRYLLDEAHVVLLLELEREILALRMKSLERFLRIGELSA